MLLACERAVLWCAAPMPVLAAAPFVSDVESFEQTERSISVNRAGLADWRPTARPTDGLASSPAAVRLTFSLAVDKGERRAPRQSREQQRPNESAPRRRDLA